MNKWSLSLLLGELHNQIEHRLAAARQVLNHPGTKGDASEDVWRSLFRDYLPKRYQVEKAHVADSKDQFSEQIDIVVFDRQYSPFIFQFNSQLVIPAESVYAAFEAKQTVTAAEVAYAQKKIATVRRLHRTSLSIPHAGGMFPPKPLAHILGGLITLESDWSPALGQPLLDALKAAVQDGDLDIGCVAAHGMFERDKNDYHIVVNNKAATVFMFSLIAKLQEMATVPMIDVRAYLNWL
jgi:Domain of unknown function (DUF6602)